MDSYNDLWKLVRDYCKQNISETAYNLWFSDMKLVSFEDDKVVLSENSYKAEIVRKKFMDLLNKGFETVIGFPIEIEILSEETEQEIKRKQIEKDEENNGTGNSISSKLTFSTFVVGSSNKYAHAAAMAVATTPGIIYNPLFIYGNSGLGKTHLLNAICAEMKSNNPDAKIIYTNGEDFTNELINCLEKKKMPQFHDKYRTLDALLIDDIQFIAGKTQTQEEFFHTFNTLVQDNKQIVLASDRPPKEIARLEDRIKTRFEWGLLADIQPPDFETRMAIIKQKSDEYNLDLSDDVIQYIAENIKSNIRQLEGAVKKLNAYTTITNNKPTINITQRAIQDIMSEKPSLSSTIDKILSEVARSYDTTVENIVSNKRNAKISKARQAAMYIIREVTSLSMEKIGEKFGNKNHSTVLYNIRKEEEEINNNPTEKNTVQGILNNINEYNSTT